MPFFFENEALPVQVAFMDRQTVLVSGSPSKALTEENLARFYHVQTCIINQAIPFKGTVKHILPVQTLDHKPETLK